MCNLEWEMMKKYASIGERRMNFETTANNQYSAYLEVRRLLVVKRTEEKIWNTLKKLRILIKFEA